MQRKYRLQMGPMPSGNAAKFWNVAAVSEDEGEITLYGDVMSQQPTNWWTGEPEPGLYITPEGFMEDLADVKDKAHITVKLNSCGWRPVYRDRDPQRAESAQRRRERHRGRNRCQCCQCDYVRR